MSVHSHIRISIANFVLHSKKREITLKPTFFGHGEEVFTTNILKLLLLMIHYLYVRKPPELYMILQVRISIYSSR